MQENIAKLLELSKKEVERRKKKEEERRKTEEEEKAKMENKIIKIGRLLKRKKSENLKLDSKFANKLAEESRSSWKEGMELKKTEERLKNSNEMLGLLVRRQKSELFWKEKRSIRKNKSQILGKQEENKSFLENLSFSKPLLRKKSQSLDKNKSIEDFGFRHSVLDPNLFSQSSFQNQSISFDKRQSLDPLKLAHNRDQLGLQHKTFNAKLNSEGSSSNESSFSICDLSYNENLNNLEKEETLSEKMGFSLGSVEWLSSEEEDIGRRRKKRRGKEMEVGRVKGVGIEGFEEEGKEFKDGKSGMERAAEKLMEEDREKKEGGEAFGEGRMEDKEEKREDGEGREEKKEEDDLIKETKEEYSKMMILKEKPYLKLKKFRLLGNIDHTN